MATRPAGSTSSWQRLRRGPWPEAVAARLAEALDAVARELRRIDGVAALVLFGSFARGEQGRKSDVDLLVLARPGPGRSLDDIGREVSRFMLDAETAFRLPMHLPPLVADAGAPESLGADLLHAIWSDGVVLFAEAAALAALRPADLSPWVVVRFSSSGRPRHEAVRLSRRLHGRGDRPGIVAAPAVELGRGALLVPASQARALREALDEAGATYDAIDVWRAV